MRQAIIQSGQKLSRTPCNPSLLFHQTPQHRDNQGSPHPVPHHLADQKSRPTSAQVSDLQKVTCQIRSRLINVLEFQFPISAINLRKTLRNSRLLDLTGQPQFFLHRLVLPRQIPGNLGEIISGLHQLGDVPRNPESSDQISIRIIPRKFRRHRPSLVIVFPGNFLELIHDRLTRLHDPLFISLGPNKQIFGEIIPVMLPNQIIGGTLPTKVGHSLVHQNKIGRQILEVNEHRNVIDHQS